MNNRYREEELEKNEDSVVEPEVMDKEQLDIESLKVEKEELELEVNKLKEQMLRVLADTDNFKKRIEEERIRERKYGSQRLLEKLIEALDVFDKAVNVNTDDQKLRNFLIGFDMINNRLKSVLEEEGVKRINALDQKFNPNFHHAIEKDNQEDKEDDIILEELQTGYMYKDRVLRASLVKVNKLNKEEINNE